MKREKYEPYILRLLTGNMEKKGEEVVYEINISPFVLPVFYLKFSNSFSLIPCDEGV
jgi:hypothetical protein